MMPHYTHAVWPAGAGVDVRIAGSRVFMICTNDDRPHVEPTVNFYLELLAKEVPSEMHIYTYGGDGFALRPTAKAAPGMTWPERLKDWMTERGFWEQL